MWVAGDSPHHEVDGEHLLGLGLLALDETPDAGGRNGIWGTPSATFREQLPGSGSSRSPGCRSRRLSRSTAWPSKVSAVHAVGSGPASPASRQEDGEVNCCPEAEWPGGQDVIWRREAVACRGRSPESKEATVPAHSAAAHTGTAAGLTKPTSSGPSNPPISTGSKIHTSAPRVDEICIRPLNSAPKKRLLLNCGSLRVT